MRKDTQLTRSVGEVTASASATLDHLYSDYRERLMRFVLPRVDEDRHVAEDIVQETFTAALVSLAGFRSQSSHYTWLCSIAQHKISDHYRRRASVDINNEGSIDPDACVTPGEDEHHSTVEHWLEVEETKETVRHALAQLPSSYEDALRLKYFDGFSVIEISHRIGRSPKAVEGLLARGRRSLLLELTRSTTLRS